MGMRLAAVKTLHQLFDERDPSPFPERDLNEKFATYVLSSVQEFPLKAPIKLRVLVQGDGVDVNVKAVLPEAFQKHFAYEARVARVKNRERGKTSRWFLLLGLLCLFAWLSIAQLLASIGSDNKFLEIAREGFVIIGWVGMWRPVDVILYDWWPLREQRLYLEKVSAMDVEIQFGSTAN